MLIPFLSSSYGQAGADENGLLMLVVTCTGLIVVFLVLVILIMVFNIFGLFSKSKKPVSAGKTQKKLDSSPAQKAAAPAAAALPGTSPGISDEIIAAISAAVAVTLDGKPFVIRNVRRAPSGRNAWSSAGILENTRPF